MRFRAPLCWLKHFQRDSPSAPTSSVTSLAGLEVSEFLKEEESLLTQACLLCGGCSGIMEERSTFSQTETENEFSLSCLARTVPDTAQVLGHRRSCPAALNMLRS